MFIKSIVWPSWVKLSKPFFDLAIVITGVTVAFLLNNWNIHQSDQAERVKVITSLQRELKTMTEFFPSMALYQENMSTTWDSLHQRGLHSDFHHYYYLQPQHNYSVIEYAINTRNSAVVSFHLYEQLLILYKLIKMLEESEVYMTQVALEYRPALGKDYEAVHQHNLFLYHRFIGFSRNRSRSLREANRVAQEIVVLLERELPASNVNR